MAGRKGVNETSDLPTRRVSETARRKLRKTKRKRAAIRQLTRKKGGSY